MEDSLSKGLPIQNEIEALHPYLKGIDKDSLLELVLSSLPEETQKYGSDTLLQLNHKASIWGHCMSDCDYGVISLSLFLAFLLFSLNIRLLYYPKINLPLMIDPV